MKRAIGRKPIEGIVKRSIQNMIEDGEIPNGTRIPSIRDLSAQFNTSKRSVLNALDSLVDDEFLVRKPKSGFYACSEHEPATTPAYVDLDRGKGRVTVVAADIARDIEDGEYKAGDYLPHRKALQYTYRTSPRTLNRALDIMEKHGFIHRKGISFLVGRRTAGPDIRNKEVRLIGAPPFSLRMPNFQIIKKDFLYAFETELANAGVLLSHIQRKGRFGYPSLQQGKAGQIIGYLHLCTPNWLESKIGTNPGNLKNQMRVLANLDKPVLLFEYQRILDRFPQFSFKPYPNIQPIGIRGGQAGEETAAYLAGKGHRHVAFVSYSTEPWNRERIDGLCRGMRKAWGKEAIVEHWGAGIDKLSRWGRHLHKSDLPEKMVNDLTARLFGGYRISQIKYTIQVNQLIGRLVVLDHHYAALEPLLKSAVRNRAITAWVCADPTVAVVAKRFLANRGIYSPQRVGLVSLDDNESTLNLRVTAYNLQLPKMGYLAAHCLLGDIPVRKNRRGFVESSGKIIDRGSVGRV